jgi:hypothetical protein
LGDAEGSIPFGGTQRDVRLATSRPGVSLFNAFFQDFARKIISGCDARRLGAPNFPDGRPSVSATVSPG